MQLNINKEEIDNYVVELRRYFHRHPELSHKEFKTSEKIQEELTRLGVSFTHCGKGPGIKAVIKGEKPGKTFMLRADMDALPVQELNNIDYKSENEGVSHACGHDCHIAVLLGATKILSQQTKSLCGTVVLCFQPAEETVNGAQEMIDGGILEGVDACFGLHVWSEVPAGKVSVPPGPRMASDDLFHITVKGKGGHGAMPETAVDALFVGCKIATDLQSIICREISPKDTAVITCGTFQAGTGANVIAETAKISGTVRTFNPSVRKSMEERIRRITSSIAEAHKATAEIEYSYEVGPLVNSPKISSVAERSAIETFGKDALFDYAGTMCSEDFAVYLEHVPGAFAFVGINNNACDACWPQHSGHYQVDENVLGKSSIFMACTALNYLSEAES